MCGLLGEVNFYNKLNDLELLIKATNSLAHRGPDDGAYWMDNNTFFGHRRLSIIGVDSGKQPMIGYESRYVIVFNGEIYNYKELKKELILKGCFFRTISDTEVIIHGYHIWKEELPKKIVGMFAFAIYDRLKNEVFLTRDRLGEKPLFIYFNNGKLIFSSRLSTLCMLLGREKEIDINEIAKYLALNYSPGTNTLLKNVRKVKPGSWEIYGKNGTKSGVYWNIQKRDNIVEAKKDFTHLQMLQSHIDGAVEKTLTSDVPITTMLSGGIDSSIITESAHRLGGISTAYCLSFPNIKFNEAPQAQFVANKLGIRLSTVEMRPHIMESFIEYSKHADTPLGDSSILPVWTLSQAISKSYKVALSGDGADELFGGYLTYRATYIHKLLTQITPNHLLTLLTKLSSQMPINGAGKVSTSYKLMRMLRSLSLPSQEAHFSFNGSFMPSEVNEILISHNEHNFNVLAEIANEHSLKQNSSLNEYQLADATEYLTNDILIKSDSMSMAHGLEVRAPFLNHSLVNFAVNLPQCLKMRPFGKSKYILRQYAQNIFGKQISHAKKQGFSIPIHDWLRASNGKLINEILDVRTLNDIPFLNTHRIMELKTLHLSGKQQIGFELWGLMILVQWYNNNFLNASSSSNYNDPYHELAKVE